MAEQGLSYTQSISKGSDEYDSMVESTRFPAIINLNVGGRQFTTHLSTLTKDPNSMLAAMFSGRHPVSKDQDGRYFIDMDGDIFAHILNYLRFEKVPPIDTSLEVYEYAVYFGIQSLVEEMKLFESVANHKYIEKAKVYYPNYKEILKDIAAQLEQKIADTSTDTYIFILTIYNTRNSATAAGQLSYQSHPDDESGKLFGKLILVEFRKRGIMLFIQYFALGNIQLKYQWDLHGHKTDDKMLQALDKIASNSNRIH